MQKVTRRAWKDTYDISYILSSGVEMLSMARRRIQDIMRIAEQLRKLEMRLK